MNVSVQSASRINAWHSADEAEDDNLINATACPAPKASRSLISLLLHCMFQQCRVYARAPSQRRARERYCAACGGWPPARRPAPPLPPAASAPPPAGRPGRRPRARARPPGCPPLPWRRAARPSPPAAAARPAPATPSPVRIRRCSNRLCRNRRCGAPCLRWIPSKALVRVERWEHPDGERVAWTGALHVPLFTQSGSPLPGRLNLNHKTAHRCPCWRGAACGDRANGDSDISRPRN